jgi:hypothetical protein
VTTKYRFLLERADPRRPLPHKIIVAPEATETAADVVLKLLAYLLFHRDRLQIQARLHDDNIPFLPDLVQLDYELRPALWIECGDCSVDRLARLAVKVPSAELWVVQASTGDQEALLHAMQKAGLRRQRYDLIGFEVEMIQELLSLLQTRNHVLWVQGSFDPPRLQFDFNGLWFDAAFRRERF